MLQIDILKFITVAWRIVVSQFSNGCIEARSHSISPETKVRVKSILLDILNNYISEHTSFPLPKQSAGGSMKRDHLNEPELLKSSHGKPKKRI